MTTHVVGMVDKLVVVASRQVVEFFEWQVVANKLGASQRQVVATGRNSEMTEKREWLKYWWLF